jgi:rhodanese-related sulfurtransferase
MKDLWIWLAIAAIAVAAVVFVNIRSKPHTPAQEHEQHHGQTASNEEIVNVASGSYRNIGVEQFHQMLQQKDFLLVNVHIPYEGELPQTDLFIPFNEIEQNLDELPSDKGAKIVLYCKSGRMSAIAAETMAKLGFTNIWNLKEGMNDWQAHGHQLLFKQL